MRTGRTVHVPASQVAAETSCGTILTNIILLIMLIGAPVFVGWAETQRRTMTDAFAEVLPNIQHLQESSPPSSSHTGLPIHMVSSHIHAPEGHELVDSNFNLHAPSNALKLKRITEYCQWQEFSTDKKNDDGSKTRTYYYVKSWRSHRILSIGFNQPASHHNPMRDPYPNQEWVLSEAKVGDNYRLSSSVIQAAKPWKQHVPSQQDVARTFPGSIAASNSFKYIDNGGYFYSQHEESSSFRILRGIGQFLEGSLLDFQIGDLFSTCTAGDIRIRYDVVAASPSASILAKQVTNDGLLDSFRTSSGFTIGLLHTHDNGIFTASEMFEREQQDFKWTVIASRLCLLAFMFIFTKCPKRPLLGPIALTGLSIGLLMAHVWGIADKSALAMIAVSAVCIWQSTPIQLNESTVPFMTKSKPE